ncbi:MAG: RhuM family protein [Candidatus Paceibacterota bacterium]
MNKTRQNQIINPSENKVILYTDKRGNVELRADVEKDTLWATQDQIAYIFDTTKQTISWHILNIFKQRELNRKTTVKESLTVLKNGRQYLTKFYNLDVAIAVGYRVNSKKATKFRIWATRTLREYLINGFTLDQKKLVKSEQNFNNLQAALKYMKFESKGGPVKARMNIRVFKDLEVE